MPSGLILFGDSEITRTCACGVCCHGKWDGFGCLEYLDWDDMSVKIESHGSEGIGKDVGIGS